MLIANIIKLPPSLPNTNLRYYLTFENGDPLSEIVTENNASRRNARQLNDTPGASDEIWSPCQCGATREGLHARRYVAHLRPRVWKPVK